jgi:diacylglycerol kinase (ATP)
MRIALLYNKDAGGGVSEADLRVELRRAGHKLVQTLERDSVGTAFDVSTELVVAAGGDGTVATAANIVTGSQTPLAILPLGTANNIAKSLGIGYSIPQLITGWARARRLSFDLGIVRGQWGESRFLEAVGGGLIPAGIAEMRSDPKNKGEEVASRLARAVRKYSEVLSCLKGSRWTLTLDGTRMDEQLLLFEVLNIPWVGPNLLLAPDANPSDGFFTIVTATEHHRQELAGYLRARGAGKSIRLSLPTRRAQKIEIQGSDSVHVDDEVHSGPTISRMSIRMEAAALTVLA